MLMQGCRQEDGDGGEGKEENEETIPSRLVCLVTVLLLQDFSIFVLFFLIQRSNLSVSFNLTYESLEYENL